MTEEKELPTIGKYELIEKVGEGGFGTVYKAKDPGLDRFVAVKLLHRHLTADATTLERFRQEAKQAARLKHTNIGIVYEVGESQGDYYISMEYVHGQPLSQIIEDEGPLEPIRVVKIVQQLGQALDYAHQNGVIHRDVKPSNIIIGTADRATLTDFGIVKAAGESGLTTTGGTLGTPKYMAPEQILDEEPNPCTDTYALGVIAYQMLTGEVPFTGTNPFTIQKGHTEKTPPDPREINPSLGEHITKVLIKALEKKPDDRYQTGASFSTALDRAVEREQEQYWDGLYLEALALMNARRFKDALEKWETIQRAYPDFRDVSTQIKLTKEQIRLSEQYSQLLHKMEQLKEQAKEILYADEDYPDRENVFERLGLRKVKKIENKILVRKRWIELFLLMGALTLSLILANLLWVKLYYIDDKLGFRIYPTGLSSPFFLGLFLPAFILSGPISNLARDNKYIRILATTLISFVSFWGLYFVKVNLGHWPIFIPYFLVLSLSIDRIWAISDRILNLN